MAAAKDIAQATHLLAWLCPNRRDTVAAALDELTGRGKGWTARFKQRVTALFNAYPRLADDNSIRNALATKH